MLDRRMRNTFHVSNEGLSQAFDFIASFVSTSGLSDSVGGRLSVIVDEVCSNLLRHASSVTADDVFEVDLELNASEIKMVISDHGREFDPLEHQVDPAQDLGGHGIAIIKGLAKTISYQRMDNRNVLTIILPSSSL